MVNWVHLILILGAVQGFFLTVLIFHKHRELYANRFLATIILMYSVILVHLVLDETAFYSSIVLVKYSVETLPLFISPLHYLYARALVRKKRYASKMLVLHSLPAILYLVFRIASMAMNLEYSRYEERSLDYIFYNWTINIQGLSYMIFTLLLINSYTKTLKEMFAALERVKLTWLRNITILMLSLLLIFFTENFLFLFDINFSHFFNLTSILMAVSIYALGYMGLSRSEVFSSSEIATPISQLYQVDASDKDASYEKSGLSEEKAEQYQKELLALMKSEELFRDNNLTLSKVAGKLNISTHNLSEVINKHIQMNFFDFINSYRVEQVKKELLAGEKQNLTLIAIAYEAGFNSKSSFNAIFKKHTGKTPSEFRK